MSEEVKFIRDSDRISQLAQRPSMAAEVAQVRAEMAEACRVRRAAAPAHRTEPVRRSTQR